MRRTGQALIACFIVLLLFVPVAIIASVNDMWTRFGIIIAASTLFILSVSAMTKGNTRELFIAGAT